MTPIDFIVTGWRRSGTTMFVSLLNDHPDLDCDNDSFNYFFAGPDYFEFLKSGTPVAPRKADAKLYGLKTLDPFLVPNWKHKAMARRAARDGHTDTIPDFAAYQAMIAAFTDRLIAADLLVLNVVRHTLEIYVSEQIALQRREFRFKSDFDESFRLVFDIDHFRPWFRAKQEVEARIAFLKKPERMIHIFYEDFRDTDQRQATMDHVFDHLGVPRRLVKPATRKQLPDSLRETVLNHDEMLAMLEAEGWPQLTKGLR